MKKKLLLIAILVFSLSLCIACGESSSDSGVTHTHEYVWSIVEGSAPTEEAEGKAQGVCACGEKVNAHVAKLTDTAVWSLETTAATCNAKGAKKYTSKYGEVIIELPIDESAHNLQDVAAKGHTCTEAGVIAHKHCSICGKNFGADGNVLASVENPEDPAAHLNIVTDAAVEATCTKEGKTAGSHCETCGEVIKAQETIPAKPHTPVTIAGKAATCTETGLTDGTKCSVCNEIIKKQETIPAKGHTPVTIAGKDATCTESGLTEGSKCSVCGAVLTKQTEIPAKGHTTVTIADKAATCTESGLTEGSKCSVCGTVFTEQTEIPAKGHSYDEYGECTACGTPEFADMSFAAAQSSGATTLSSKGVVKFANGVAKDTIINPVGTYDLNCSYYTSCKKTITSSTITVSFIDKVKGLVKVECEYVYDTKHDPYGSDWTGGCEKEDETGVTASVVYTAYYDAITKTLVFAADRGASWSYFLVPSATEVSGSCFATTYYNNDLAARPVSYVNGETVINFFIENGKVTAGVEFVDENGNALTPDKFDKTAKTPVFRVVKNGALIASFGYIDNSVIKLDGFEGTYTSEVVGIESFKLNGAGVITIGDVNGTYVVDGSKVLATISNEAGEPVAYYEIAIENGVATVVVPKVTVTYKITEFADAEIEEENKNVAVSLKVVEETEQVIDGVLKKFCGWLAEDGTVVSSGEKVVLSADATYTGIWKTIVTYTVKDESAKREDVSVKVVEGESVLAALKAQYGEKIEIDGKKFTATHWFVKIDGEDDFVIDESVIASADDNGAILYVAWKQPAKVAVIDANSTVTEIELDDGDVIVEKLPAHDSCIGGYKFEGWYKDAAFGTAIEAETVMSDELGLTEIYAKWTWAGNIKFDLGKYTFVYDSALGIWKSNNQGKTLDAGTASIEITATEGVSEVSFKYFVSSESNYDKLTVNYIDANGKWTSDVISGNSGDDVTYDNIGSWGWKTITTTIDASADSNKSVRFSYRKDGSGDRGLDTAFIKDLTINGVLITNAAPLDRLGGSYASGETVITLNGNGIVTSGEQTGTYTIIDEAANKLGVTLGGVYSEIVLDLTAKTYTDVTPEVTLTYDLGGHGALEALTETVKLNAVITLPVPAADGYIFRGWYSDAEFATALGSTYTVAADATVYAKWDAAVAVTVRYNKDGLTDKTIPEKFVNDALTAAEVGDDPVDPSGAQVFMGWYTDAAFTTAWTAGSVLTETEFNLYAKWADPSVYAGSYYGIELSASSGSSYYTNKFTVDGWGKTVIPSYMGFAKDDRLSFEDINGELFIKDKNGYYYYAKAINGVIFVGNSSYYTVDSARATGFNAKNTYVYVPDTMITTVSAETVSAFAIGKNDKLGYIKALSLALKTGTVNYFIDKTEVYSGVSFKTIEETALTFVDMANSDSLVVVSGETVIAKYARADATKDFAAADAYAGVYACGADTLVLNGAGVAKLVSGETETAGTYTVKTGGENTVALVAVGETYVKLIINVTDKTYVKDETPVTVNFNLSGKGDTAVKTVVKGVPFVAASVYGADPVYEGFAFKGWYKDAECTEAVGSTETVEEETTYYAKWAQIVTVTIVYGNGLEDHSFDIPAGDNLGLSEYKPAYTDGKLFEGWYKNADLTEKFTDTSVTESTTIYVKWMQASPLYGTWKSIYVYANSAGDKGSATRINYTTTVSVDGKFSGEVDGTATGLGENGGFFTVGKYAAYYDMASDLLVICNPGSSATTSLGAALTIFAKAGKIETPAVQVLFDKGVTRILNPKIDGVETLIVIHNNQAFMNVDVVAIDASGNELAGISDYSKAAKITVKRAGTETVL